MNLLFVFFVFFSTTILGQDVQLQVIISPSNYLVTQNSDTISITRGGFLKDKIVFESDSLVIIENYLTQRRIEETLSIIHFISFNRLNHQLTERKFTNLVLSDTVTKRIPINLLFDENTCSIRTGSKQTELEKVNINESLIEKIASYYCEIE